MKQLLTLGLLFISVMASNAQKNSKHEYFGNTLNIGVGIGYYGYINNPLPVAILNYEIDVARNFTLAPFISFYSYRNSEYGYNTTPNGYTYKETVVPIGIKGAYYFDELFHTNSKWDIYAAGSLGFIVRKVRWNNTYYGTHNVYGNPTTVYADAHVGAEYHIARNAGLFLDISTGVSTFGLAIHFNH